MCRRQMETHTGISDVLRKAKETDVKHGIINQFSLIQQSFIKCLFCSEDCGSFQYSLLSEIITKGFIFTEFPS